MAKRHIKRIAAPKRWEIRKKTSKFIAKPNPGAHRLEEGVSLRVVFKEMLKRAITSKEAKKILHNNEILVDKTRRKDSKFIMGFMDVISISKTGEDFRMVINPKGKLELIKIDKKESNLKVSKIIKKTKIKGGNTQLNLSDSRNIIVDKDEYKIGDSLLLELPGQKIKEHLKFEKDSIGYFIGGKLVGSTQKIEGIKGKNVVIKPKTGSSITTLKKYVFVIGKEKEAVTVVKRE